MSASGSVSEKTCLHLNGTPSFFQGDLQQLTIVPNPEAAYELCNDFLPDCDKPLPKPPASQESELPPDGGPHQDDDSRAGYMGMSEDELLNREGLSPQQYLEFTEAEARTPPPVQWPPPSTEEPPTEAPEEDDSFNYVSVAGEPGLRGPTGVRMCQ